MAERLVHMLHQLPVLTAPAELRIVWRDGAGTMQAWIGDAGMLVEDGVLRCSDGFAPPRFSDLEVTLALT